MTATQTRDTTYNGYTNYATWAVKLWIDNEESTQVHWLDMARCAKRGTRKGGPSATYHLAEWLQEQITEGAPKIDNSVYSDLMTHALGSVHWYEIAETLLEDMDDL